MLAVTRFVVPAEQAADFLHRAQVALAALAVRPGYLRGSIGRAADDETLWVLASEWTGAGAYRRALSAFDGKISAVPLLSQGLDGPGAYEVVHSRAADGADRS